tara:strand:+ start:159 stop:563 length:405 start_codon:yes stop_codon:yes gene_type:complete
MSRLRKPTTVVAPSDYESEPTDYVPQHPLAAFRHVPTTAEDVDHLEQYAEVRPFENAEGKRFKKLRKGVGSLFKSRRFRKAAKKVEQSISKIETEEKIVRKQRAQFKGEEDEFDKRLLKKLDASEDKIYKKVIK